MGGRGANYIKSRVKRITVDYGNGVKSSFISHKGKVYDERYEIVPRTISQIKAGAEKNGYKYSTETERQYKKAEAKRKADRVEVEEFLNSMSAKDRTSTYRAPRSGWKGH